MSRALPRWMSELPQKVSGHLLSGCIILTMRAIQTLKILQHLHTSMPSEMYRRQCSTAYLPWEVSLSMGYRSAGLTAVDRGHTCRKLLVLVITSSKYVEIYIIILASGPCAVRHPARHCMHVSKVEPGSPEQHQSQM